MIEDMGQWFVVLPGAQRKGEVITLPLMFIGKEILSNAEMIVFGDHINGMTTTDGGFLRPAIELGDLASGDKVRLIVHTDGDPGRLAFTLDFLANESHLRKLRVEVPEPVSVPVVTEHLESDRGDVTKRWPS